MFATAVDEDTDVWETMKLFAPPHGLSSLAGCNGLNAPNAAPALEVGQILVKILSKKIQPTKKPLNNYLSGFFKSCITNQNLNLLDRLKHLKSRFG